jgi:uncharacterized protein (TIGR02118 family)
MRTKTLLILGIIGFLAGCQPTGSAPSAAAPESREGMIKVTILYPNGDGKTFDMDYYANVHMPMVANLLGDSLRLFEIDRGLAGRTPDEPIPFLAIGYLYFDQLSAFQNSFGPNAEAIRGDIPNYTNIQPVLQISEVLH